MAAVLVTGGTGRLGRHVVRLLVHGDNDVRILSRRPEGRIADGAAALRGDLATGEGVAGALAGVDAVVHAASNSDRGAGAEDVSATRHLLDALPCGVRHFVYVSIVGVDRIPYRYYAHKLACERLVEASGVPFTIVRATQFHELAESMLRRLERRPIAAAPLGVRAQLVAAAEVAAAIGTVLEGDPEWGRVEFGGPEVLTGSEIVAVWRARRNRPRVVVPKPLLGPVWRGFREGLNTTPEHADGRETWREYVGSLD